VTTQDLKNQTKSKKTFNKKSWIVSQLRRISLRYPPAIRARNRTKEEYFIASKKGKQLRRVKFTCEKCGKKDLKRTETELDHIQPVINVATGFVDWNSFLERHFVEENGYQLLCISCHEQKTLLEGGTRKKQRQKKKAKNKRK
jgi:5-methylcytosine-specific restriction endonuclease McrA